MEFNHIKNLIKQNGDKFIFLDNGEPEMVMMSFGEYQKLATRNANIQTHASTANYGYRTEATDLEGGELRETEFIAPVAVEAVGLPVRLEDIRLEDLPI